MARKFLDHPDSFSVSPMLALLPVLGQVSQLDSLTSFFFARYEKVRVMLASIDADSDPKHLNAELSMLRQALDWLEVKPEES